MTRLEIAPRAKAQMRAIAEWWRENREAAPELFRHELADALEAIVRVPTSDARFGEQGGVEIRRLSVGPRFPSRSPASFPPLSWPVQSSSCLS